MSEPIGPDGPVPEPPHIVVERDGPVMTLTLNRPARKNALTVSMIGDITEAVRAASLDDTTRVILLRAAGVEFCSGIDLVESNAPSDPSAPRERPRAGHMNRRLEANPHRMIRELAAAQVPVVAAVRGWAVGIGNMLALSADVVVATPSTKFWVPFTTKGFTPDSGNTWLIPRLIGLARAKEMVLRGRPIDGETAAAWGLIGHCVAEEAFEEKVAEIVADFASAATVSVGLTKSLLHENLEVGLAAALRNEAIHEELAVRSDDFKEGMRAFTQRRTPDYTGW